MTPLQRLVEQPVACSQRDVDMSLRPLELLARLLDEEPTPEAAQEANSVRDLIGKVKRASSRARRNNLITHRTILQINRYNHSKMYHSTPHIARPVLSPARWLLRACQVRAADEGVLTRALEEARDLVLRAREARAEEGRQWLAGQGGGGGRGRGQARWKARKKKGKKKKAKPAAAKQASAGALAGGLEALAIAEGGEGAAEPVTVHQGDAGEGGGEAADDEEYEEEEDEGDEENCAICLSAFGAEAGEGGEEAVEALVCGHVFHESCVETWICTCQTRGLNLTCPYCRAPLARLGGEGAVVAARMHVQPRLALLMAHGLRRGGTLFLSRIMYRRYLAEHCSSRRSSPSWLRCG
jgi:hypothetical protein